MRGSLLVALPVLLLAAPAWGMVPVISGDIETRHAAQVRDSNDTLASETRLRLEASAEGDRISVFAALNASEDHRDTDESEVRLHEGYVDITGEGWDLRAGRQILIWGNSDALQVTDILCPSDLSEFSTRDLDEIRMAVDAVDFRLTGSEALTLEAVWIPDFKPAELPSASSPWRVGPEIRAEEPGGGLGNGEYAFRASWFLPGVDLTLSAARIWNDLPAVLPDGNGTKTGYTRTHFAGLTMSTPSGRRVFRGELAWFSDRPFTASPPGEPDVEKPFISAIVGCDWYPGSDWTLSAQLMGESILDHDKQIATPEHRGLATFRASRKLLREKLELGDMAFFDLEDESFYNRFSADYEILDGFHASAGFDLFAGENSSRYGRYHDNSQIWIRAKYSF